VERVEHGALAYYRFAQWPDLKHGVFTRHGGVSQAPWHFLNTGGTLGDDVAAVRQNHELIYDALHINADQRRRSVTVWQIHSADVVIVNGPVRGRRWAAQADSMITDQPDTPLVMRYADCTPIMLYDPSKGVIGTAHAGWRGTVLGVASRTVRAMKQAYGCRPQDIQAAIGPAIGPDRYQVGEEVVQAVANYFGAVDGLIRRDWADGTAYFDLWAANRRDLEWAGVEIIEVAGLCTAARTDEFFSHRAERGRTGRFGTVITL
jgi:hypothetical protein